MKKILSAAVATALIATSSFALDTDKIYGGAGVALESANGFDSGFALALTGGLPVMPAGEAGPGTLAVEGEFTYSIIPPAVGDFTFSAMTLAAYAAYTYDIDSQFYVKPRAGLVYRSYTADYSSPFGKYSDSTSEIGLAFGVGGGYKLNKKMDIYLDYTMLDGSDLTHLTAGVNYKF